MVVIIPAYDPDYHLINVIEGLSDYTIIVVNDGSSKNKDNIFNEIKNKVILLNHTVNKGKGAAMKTALKYIKDNMIEDGFIFADADGQHDKDDIINLIKSFYTNSNNLLIGTRLFDKNVPIRSRLGNKITRQLFKFKTGKYITDTQSGLRCISAKYIDLLLDIKGNRYEYEINMLKVLIEHNILIKEIPIKTIYEDKKNYTSHFKVIRDSYLIYKELFKR